MYKGKLKTLLDEGRDGLLFIPLNPDEAWGKPAKLEVIAAEHEGESIVEEARKYGIKIPIMLNTVMYFPHTYIFHSKVA